MHAVVVRVTIEDREAAEKALKAEIVPRVSQAPGFVAGYWTNVGSDQGRSMIVFESEDAASSAEANIREDAPDFVTFDSIETGEVVAHA